MENRVNILKEIGHDISGIINGVHNPIVLASFYKIHRNQDIVIPEWTEEEIILFSNKIYNIIKKYCTE